MFGNPELSAGTADMQNPLEEAAQDPNDAFDDEENQGDGW